MGPYSSASLINDRVGLSLSINGRLPSGPYVFGWGMADTFYPLKHPFKNTKISHSLKEDSNESHGTKDM